MDPVLDLNPKILADAVGYTNPDWRELMNREERITLTDDASDPRMQTVAGAKVSKFLAHMVLGIGGLQAMKMDDYFPLEIGRTFWDAHESVAALSHIAPARIGFEHAKAHLLGGVLEEAVGKEPQPETGTKRPVTFFENLRGLYDAVLFQSENARAAGVSPSDNKVPTLVQLRLCRCVAHGIVTMGGFDHRYLGKAELSFESVMRAVYEDLQHRSRDNKTTVQAMRAEEALEALEDMHGNPIYRNEM